MYALESNNVFVDDRFDDTNELGSDAFFSLSNWQIKLLSRYVWVKFSFNRSSLLKGE